MVSEKYHYFSEYIMAVLFLSLTLSIVGKVLSYLKVWPAEIVLIGIWPAIKKDCTPLV